MLNKKRFSEKKGMKLDIPDYKSYELDRCGDVKLVLMIMVVLYHSMLCSAGIEWGPVQPYQTRKVLYYLAQYLNRIHVYAFTFVSGYIFAFLRYETDHYSNTKRILKKKATRLLIPYIAAVFLWVLPCYCYFWRPHLKEIFKNYILGMGPSQLWFLLMLFWNFVVFQLIADKITLQKKNVLYFSVLFVIVLYLGELLNTLGAPNVLQVVSALRYFLFFYLGILFRRTDTSKLIRRDVFGGGTILSILFFALAEYCRTQDGTLRHTRILLYPVVSFFGVYACVIGLLLLYNNSAKHPTMDCGMTVYLFHQQFVYMSLCLFNRPWMPPAVLSVVNFVFAMSCSILVHKLLLKWKLTRFLFGLG